MAKDCNYEIRCGEKRCDSSYQFCADEGECGRCSQRCTKEKIANSFQKEQSCMKICGAYMERNVCSTSHSTVTTPEAPPAAPAGLTQLEIGLICCSSILTLVLILIIIYYFTSRRRQQKSEAGIGERRCEQQHAENQMAPVDMLAEQSNGTVVSVTVNNQQNQTLTSRESSPLLPNSSIDVQDSSIRPGQSEMVCSPGRSTVRSPGGSTNCNMNSNEEDIVHVHGCGSNGKLQAEPPAGYNPEYIALHDLDPDTNIQVDQDQTCPKSSELPALQQSPAEAHDYTGESDIELNFLTDDMPGSVPREDHPTNIGQPPQSANAGLNTSQAAQPESGNRPREGVHNKDLAIRYVPMLPSMERGNCAKTTAGVVRNGDSGVDTDTELNMGVQPNSASNPRSNVHSDDLVRGRHLVPTSLEGTNGEKMVTGS